MADNKHNSPEVKLNPLSSLVRLIITFDIYKNLAVLLAAGLAAASIPVFIIVYDFPAAYRLITSSRLLHNQLAPPLVSGFFLLVFVLTICTTSKESRPFWNFMASVLIAVIFTGLMVLALVFFGQQSP